MLSFTKGETPHQMNKTLSKFQCVKLVLVPRSKSLQFVRITRRPLHRFQKQHILEFGILYIAIHNLVMLSMDFPLCSGVPILPELFVPNLEACSHLLCQILCVPFFKEGAIAPIVQNPFPPKPATSTYLNQPRSQLPVCAQRLRKFTGF